MNLAVCAKVNEYEVITPTKLHCQLVILPRVERKRKKKEKTQNKTTKIN